MINNYFEDSKSIKVTHVAKLISDGKHFRYLIKIIIKIPTKIKRNNHELRYTLYIRYILIRGNNTIYTAHLIF